MVDALIFSKDRAAQLDLLLRSIELHAKERYERIMVLWTVSDGCYRDGYEMLMRQSSGLPLTFYAQGPGFEIDVRKWLDNAGVIVSFLCDDDVFYRTAPEPRLIPWSFRGGDFDYPFSLDGNVYVRDEIIHLLRGLRFSDPTQLEAQGHDHRRRLTFTEVNHANRGCLVGVPANRVSASSRVPFGTSHQFDLNERYLQGERLLMPQVADDLDLAAHAQLPLLMVKP